MLVLTCPLDSTGHLEAARDHKQEKMEYLEIMPEFQCWQWLWHIRIEYSRTLLTTVICFPQKCINFIQDVQSVTVDEYYNRQPLILKKDFLGSELYSMINGHLINA